MTKHYYPGSVRHISVRRRVFRLLRLACCCVAAILLLPLLEAPLPRHESDVRQSLDAIDASAAPRDPLSRLGITLKRGDTLLALLTRHGLPLASAHELIAKVRPLVNLRKLKTGDQVDLVVHDGDRSVHGMEVKLEDNIVHAKATADGWDVERRTIPSELTTRVIRGAIKSSLYDNGLQAGLSAEHILELSKIFEYDIDFFSDFRRDDQFSVIVEERHYADGRRVPERIVAAELETGGESNEAFHFAPQDGEASYYDAEGKELRRSFLRAPLSYSRISSFFSVARRHPIFRMVRPHLAIDYAAPTGTPVVAIGHGRIRRAGWYGGYGNFVEIAHGNGYASRYGHFSRVARGLRLGAEVKAGDVIGYVGQTGHATGPHLHFEFLQGGKKVNFLALKIPRIQQLTGAELARFQREREVQLARLNEPEQQTATPAS